ncbi:MAG: hypothetical protein ACOX06_01320 [Candidatus Dojkabacteria bacterium]|jgi:hypothetical protein
MKKVSKKGKTEEEQYKQLDLEIEEPFKNRFYKIKKDFDDVVIKLEVVKFLKDPLVWAALMAFLILTLYQVYIISTNINSLPTSLPIFKFYINPKNILAPKEMIYLYPIISTTISVPTFIFASRNYSREKHLTKLLLVSIIIAIISLTVILVNLVNN